LPNCEIIAADSFEKALKRLSKRYSSLQEDVLKLIDLLEKNPATGQSLGSGVYKVRLAIKSKNKGKRGGGRVITYHIVHREVLFLLTIYDKSEQESISDAEVMDLVKVAIKEHDVDSWKLL
jgi:hypothetical protein